MSHYLSRGLYWQPARCQVLHHDQWDALCEMRHCQIECDEVMETRTLGAYRIRHDQNNKVPSEELMQEIGSTIRPQGRRLLLQSKGLRRSPQGLMKQIACEGQPNATYHRPRRGGSCMTIGWRGALAVCRRYDGSCAHRRLLKMRESRRRVTINDA